MKPTMKPDIAWIKDSNREPHASLKTIEQADRQPFLEGMKMVDTVKLRFRIELDPVILERVGWEKSYKKNLRKGIIITNYYKAYRLSNNSTITARYVPRDYSKLPNFSVEFSVQKVANGGNYQIRPGEISVDRINSATNKITSEIQTPPVDVMDGEIVRIDIAKNWQVDDKVKDYIRYLSKCVYSRRTRTIYRNSPTKAKSTGENNGVSFKCDHKITKGYEKYCEAGVPESKGVLRIEVSTYGPEEITEIFNCKHPKFADISLGICQAALQKEMETLGLDNSIIGKKDWCKALRNLVTSGEITKGMMHKVLGFITYVQTYPNLDNQDLADALMVSIDTIQKFCKVCKDGEISVLDDLVESLPALSLDNPQPFKNSGEVISNTCADENRSDGETVPQEPDQSFGNTDPISIRSLIWAYRLGVKTKKVSFIFRGSARVQPGMLPWPPSGKNRDSPMAENATQGDPVNGKAPSRRSVIEGDSNQSRFD